jgi:hypothetical protein
VTQRLAGHRDAATYPPPVVAPSPPPVPPVPPVGDPARVLVAGVVPPPRFGREAEVAATAAAVADSGADLIDVSLPPRLAGAVARHGSTATSARATTLDEVTSAARLGAHVVMVPADLAVAAREALSGEGLGGTTVAVLLDQLAAVPAVRTVAEHVGAQLAFDATGLAGADAIARESAAVVAGCRLLRTADVRRSRRVAEVMSAILAARRPADGAADDAAGTHHATAADDAAGTDDAAGGPR